MLEDTDPAAMLGQAEQVQIQIRRAGLWYPAMMTAYGLITIGIVAWVPVLHGTWAAIAFGLVGVAWVVLYITAVSWFGPTYLDHTVGWWALMGVVVAAPAFTEAGRAWLRVRR